jgi:hypothetical protein
MAYEKQKLRITQQIMLEYEVEDLVNGGDTQVEMEEKLLSEVNRLKESMTTVQGVYDMIQDLKQNQTELSLVKFIDKYELDIKTIDF